MFEHLSFNLFNFNTRHCHPHLLTKTNPNFDFEGAPEVHTRQDGGRGRAGEDGVPRARHPRHCQRRPQGRQIERSQTQGRRRSPSQIGKAGAREGEEELAPAQGLF